MNYLVGTIRGIQIRYEMSDAHIDLLFEAVLGLYDYVARRRVDQPSEEMTDDNDAGPM